MMTDLEKASASGKAHGIINHLPKSAVVEECRRRSLPISDINTMRASLRAAADADIDA